MADNWYYVQKGNRHGPVAEDVITGMISRNELKVDDFVWKKGFENWMKIKDIPELSKGPEPEVVVPPQMTPAREEVVDFNHLGSDERAIFIRIGSDRGGATTDYGPFSLNQLKKLYKENRINAKTFAFTAGMREWKLLADLPNYQQLFEELPPVIQESERRVTVRKPFIARLFVQNNKNVYEGICRDISIGGMQILMDNFQGAAGDKITINVHPENTDYHFTASGVVVRVLEGNSGFSFRFSGLSDEARRAIEKYVQEN